MSVLLVRPYPVGVLASVREAIARAAAGDVRRLMSVYQLAVSALEELDPDEVEELRSDWRAAVRSDRAAARAALEVADTWEGVVTVGATISEPARFRGFAWLAAEVRYGDGRPDPAAFKAYRDGRPLPHTSPEDTALFAALPALIGLGPELAEELPGPLPLPAEPVARLLGLPEHDVEGIDPLDGLAVFPEACLAHLAGLPPVWRAVVERCAGQGLLVRRAQPV